MSGTKAETVPVDSRVTLNKCEYLTVLVPLIIVVTDRIRLLFGCEGLVVRSMRLVPGVWGSVIERGDGRVLWLMRAERHPRRGAGRIN